MKTTICVLAAMACFATAQRMSDALPSCAADCLNSGIKSATKCSFDDGDCLCEVDNYRNTYDAATACVLQACGAAKALGSLIPSLCLVEHMLIRVVFPDEVLPAAAKFCSEVTGGATAPPVDESAPSTTLSAVTSTTATDSKTTTQTPAPTGTAEGNESSGTDEPDAAPSFKPTSIFAIIAVGLAALL